MPSARLPFLGRRSRKLYAPQESPTGDLASHLASFGAFRQARTVPSAAVETRSVPATGTRSEASKHARCLCRPGDAWLDGGMTLLRAVARPMLASAFLFGGANALRYAKEVAPRAEPVARALNQIAPQIPASSANLVRANAIVQIVAGTALATGHLPRISSFVLAGSLVPSTFAGHQFWNEADPIARQNQTIHFTKNVSLMGGLLMATLDPDPHKKFIGRRAKDRVIEAKDVVEDRIEELRR